MQYLTESHRTAELQGLEGPQEIIKYNHPAKAGILQ